MKSSFQQLFDYYGASFNSKKSSNIELMRQLARYWGDPQRAFPTIHVAGTNGKGSVSTKIAVALEKQGKKVGLYTSPHLLSCYERIQINGQLADKDLVESWGTRLFDPRLNFSLWVTLTALCVFREAQVDVAVIEVGVGGRLDYTNIIEPLVSVITSIGFDHQNLLGNTLEEIAAEKAGIIKCRCPVVIPRDISCREVFEKHAARLNAPLYYADTSALSFDFKNSATAAKVLQVLKVDQEIIQEAIRYRPWGRCMQVADGRCVIDVAHNLHGIKALFASLHFTMRPLLLLGMKRDKDWKEVAAFVRERCEAIYLLEGESLVTYEEMVEWIPALRKAPTLEEFKALLSRRHPILMCGSFWIAAQAIKYLEYAAVNVPQTFERICDA